MKRFRMDSWAYVALALCLVVVVIAPQQIGVTAYKLSLLALGGVLGYWLDRSIFYYARPDDLMVEPHDSRFCFAMQRRALIVSACILGVSLGA
jgi:hypothetical protein